MITCKSNLFKGAVAVLAAIPVVAATTFASAGSAEAATLTGKADFAGTSTGLFSPITSVIAADGNIKFSDPKLVGLTGQEGSFTAFSAATIYDFDPIPGNFDPAKLFLDFGSDLAGLTDGKNIFKATSVSQYQISSDGDAGSSIALAFKGYFFGEDETEKSFGRVNLNFTSEHSVALVTDVLLNGGLNSNGKTQINAAFSGLAVVASVPEPATLLGLGVVAAGMAVSRRRNKTIPS
jgi:hypothetical protein